MSIEKRAGRDCLAWGAINGGLSVAFGAFAAHALDDSLSQRMLNVFDKAVDYQAMHALALIGCGLLMGQIGATPAVRWAGILFLSGIILFSGSLYILALTQISALGMITPLGGLAFLAGWSCLAWAALAR